MTASDSEMMEALGESEAIYILLVVMCSWFCFHVLARVVAAWLTPTSAKCSWRWKNVLVSLGHSTLTGTWALLCFYRTPKMAEDLIEAYDKFSLTLVAVSMGYFLHDIADMLIHSSSWRAYELIFHHIIIIICFGISLTTQRYIGYGVVALIVELNSIFLHTRQLMQIIRVHQDSSLYRLNGLLNLGTYIVCRISTVGWMTRWAIMNRDRVPFFHYTAAVVSLAILTVMNIVLFYRMLVSDFFRRGKEKEALGKSE